MVQEVLIMTIREIEQAASRLSSVIHRTPVSSSGTFSQMSGAELYLKCENLQKTGSFKAVSYTHLRSILTKRL